MKFLFVYWKYFELRVSNRVWDCFLCPRAMNVFNRNRIESLMIIDLLRKSCWTRISDNFIVEYYLDLLTLTIILTSRKKYFWCSDELLEILIENFIEKINNELNVGVQINWVSSRNANEKKNGLNMQSRISQKTFHFIPIKNFPREGFLTER